MTDGSYGQIDDLFKEIRLTLASVRKSDPETGDKLKGLVSQLEMWVESLVVDSLKLDSVEADLQKRRELLKTLWESFDKRSKSGSDSLQAAGGD
jgi:hypothetical protein